MTRLTIRPIVALLIVSVISLSFAASPAIGPQDTQELAQNTSTASDPEANLPYLFAAYTITWIAFFIYLHYLSQKQQGLRREVEDLRQQLSMRDGQSEM